MSNLVRVNVRCCCTPQKVFGVLEVLEEQVRSGSTRVNLQSEETCRATDIEQQVLPTYREILNPGYEEIIYKDIITPEGFERAAYSDDRPIEFWRKLDNFHEGMVSPYMTKRLRKR